ncbi:MAG: hypothetical protein DRH37_02330 [Deltaproteobacteria bacterium]|nr:MAG: hypothetical protein DRH37_02330 [Deltaproteobacteria bacterium]
MRRNDSKIPDTEPDLSACLSRPDGGQATPAGAGWVQKRAHFKGFQSGFAIRGLYATGRSEKP